MAAAPDTTAFVEVPWGGRAVRIEHRWIARERSARPLAALAASDAGIHHGKLHVRERVEPRQQVKRLEHEPNLPVS